jgi:DNA polymerase-1
VHTTFNQTGATTGRLSSSNPNLQNIPVRGELGRQIRRAFIPGSKDQLLLVADYSQIELRILAHLSGDEGLRSAFAEGRDIHAATAARVFGLAEDKVDASLRNRAKMVNYGLAYGMSAFGLV